MTAAPSPTLGAGEIRALADRLGLTDCRPLQGEPDASAALDKVVVFVDEGSAERVRRAMTDAGGGAVGAYDRCSFSVSGTGRFRPLPGARPAIGQPPQGDEPAPTERVAEQRIEMVVPRARRTDVLAALHRSHPYETPAFDVVELALPPSAGGLGRIGRLDVPVRAADFARRVADRLPATAGGVRLGGDPDRGEFNSFFDKSVSKIKDAK